MKPWLALGSLLAAATAGTAAAEFVSEFSCDGGKRAWPLDFAADATTEVCKNPQGGLAVLRRAGAPAPADAPLPGPQRWEDAP